LTLFFIFADEMKYFEVMEKNLEVLKRLD